MAISPADAEKHGLKQGQGVRLSVAGGGDGVTALTCIRTRMSPGAAALARRATAKSIITASARESSLAPAETPEGRGLGELIVSDLARGQGDV